MNAEKLEHVCVEVVAEMTPIKSVRGGAVRYDCPACGCTGSTPECGNRGCWLVRIKKTLADDGK